MFPPDSQATACPPSGRNSTYRPVQISETGSQIETGAVRDLAPRNAALHVEQQSVIGHAEARGERRDPIVFGSAPQHQHAGRSPLESGPGELRFHAEDTPAEVPIVAALHAPEEPVGLDLGNGDREATGAGRS